mmetsp:Transcript_133432/g.256752  ORF Transcript_133432/g.256752 Transcript_133432/m.256752 type:complete len:274 (-) Transcript_133432:5-826(-)
MPSFGTPSVLGFGTLSDPGPSCGRSSAAGRLHDEAAQEVDLSFSDSEPSLSPLELRRVSSPQNRREKVDAAASNADTRAGLRTGILEASEVPLQLMKGAPARFAWLQALPRKVRHQVRSCSTPQEARTVLAEALGAENVAPPTAPAGLSEDLRRHAQICQRHAFDLEEALEQQAARHRAELAMLRDEHRQRCRRAKLQLMAGCAPHKAAAAEAITCEAEPSLLAIGAALSNGGSWSGRSCATRGSLRSSSSRSCTPSLDGTQHGQQPNEPVAA